MKPFPLKNLLVIVSMLIPIGLYALFAGAVPREVRMYGFPIILFAWWWVSNRLVSAIVKDV